MQACDILDAWKFVLANFRWVILVAGIGRDSIPVTQSLGSMENIFHTFTYGLLGQGMRTNQLHTFSMKSCIVLMYCFIGDIYFLLKYITVCL